MEVPTDGSAVLEVFDVCRIYGECVFKFTNAYAIANFAAGPVTFFTLADSIFFYFIVVRPTGPDTRAVICHHVVSGAFLHTGGTKAVLPLRVDIHLVRGGVVQHEWWAGVFARGFISEPVADQTVTLSGPCTPCGTLVVAAVAGGPATTTPGTLLGADDFGQFLAVLLSSSPAASIGTARITFRAAGQVALYIH